MSFGEAIDLMEHLKDRHRLIMKENNELKDVREFQNKRIEELEEQNENKELTTEILEHYKFVREEKSKFEIENDKLTNTIKDLIKNQNRMKKINENTRRNLDHQIDDLRNENKKLKEELNLAEKALKDYHFLYDDANEKINQH